MEDSAHTYHHRHLAASSSRSTYRRTDAAAAVDTSANDTLPQHVIPKTGAISSSGMLSSPDLFLELPDLTNQEIINAANTLVDECIREQKQSAKEQVRSARNYQQQVFTQLHPYPDITPPLTNRTSPVSLPATCLSPIESPTNIPQNVLSQVTNATYEIPSNIHVTMDKVEAPPPHTAWVPVRQNFACKTPYEAYVPYLGADKEDLAMKAYNIMHDLELKDSAFDIPSDGEPNDDYIFVSTDSTPNHLRTPDSLQTLRLRFARRQAALRIVRKYGHHAFVFKALSAAFDMPSVNHARAVYKVAKLRHTEKSKRNATIQKMNRYGKEVREASHYPHRAVNILPQLTCAQGALEHYCFYCHMFTCDLHDDMRPAPRRYIPDESKELRLSDLESGFVSPCSNQCFLLPEGERVLDHQDAVTEWDFESDALLQEAIMMCGNDPCNLSIIIGSKTCIQVHNKLEASRGLASDMMRRATNERSDHELVRKWSDERREKRKERESESFDDTWEDSVDYSDKLMPDKEKRIKDMSPGQKESFRTARKTSGHDNELLEDLGDAVFIPCVHDGPCTPANCSCCQKSRVCMPVCGCNGVRHTYSSSANQIVRKGIECEYSPDGCNCPGGVCTPDTCGCYINNESTCSPDICPCDCQLPDSKKHSSRMKCRNFDLWHHKRTFVGKSTVEGMGLFAAEDIKKGDLIGVYLGTQVPFSFSDGVNAIGDVTERTFAFDVRDMMIDGRLLGSKVKFANHGLDPPSRNCKAQDVWCQGNGYLRLIADRDFPTGTEIMFNYTLNGIEDPKWMSESRMQS